MTAATSPFQSLSLASVSVPSSITTETKNDDKDTGREINDRRSNSTRTINSTNDNICRSQTLNRRNSTKPWNNENNSKLYNKNTDQILSLQRQNPPKYHQQRKQHQQRQYHMRQETPTRPKQVLLLAIPDPKRSTKMDFVQLGIRFRTEPRSRSCIC